MVWPMAVVVVATASEVAAAADAFFVNIEHFILRRHSFMQHTVAVQASHSHNHLAYLYVPQRLPSTYSI